MVFSKTDSRLVSVLAYEWLSQMITSYFINVLHSVPILLLSYGSGLIKLQTGQYLIPWKIF